MTNTLPSIYDFPDIYDAVLRAPLAQIETEVDSVRALLARQGLVSGRILELACGTCTHAIRLAQQGFDVAGLDRSPAMLEGAQTRAKAAGAVLDLFQGDVVDFVLDTEPFDAVLFMAETFPLIIEYEDLVRHFRSVRRHLKPGGLYIVDVDAHKHGPGTTHAVWGEKTVRLDDGWVEVWHEDFPGDWVQGTSRLVMHCRIHRGNDVVETADDWTIRVDAPWHLSLLVKTLPDWQLQGFYSWRDLSEAIESEAHYFMVLV